MQAQIDIYNAIPRLLKSDRIGYVVGVTFFEELKNEGFVHIATATTISEYLQSLPSRVLVCLIAHKGDALWEPVWLFDTAENYT